MNQAASTKAILFTITLILTSANLAFAQYDDGGEGSRYTDRSSSTRKGKGNTGSLDNDGGSTSGGACYDESCTGTERDAGALGVFSEADNLTSFDLLRVYTQSLSPESLGQFSTSLKTANVATYAAAAAAIAAAIKYARLTPAGVAITAALATSTSNADVIFDERAYADNNMLFLTTKNLTSEELASFAQGNGLGLALTNLIDASADVLCTKEQKDSKALEFCNSL